MTDTDTDGGASDPISPFTIGHASRIRAGTKGLQGSGHIADAPQLQLDTNVHMHNGNIGRPGLPPHVYEVLLDIHQTLYCGRAYVHGRHGSFEGQGGEMMVRRRSQRGRMGLKSWARRVMDVRRVVERSLEGDCGMFAL